MWTAAHLSFVKSFKSIADCKHLVTLRNSHPDCRADGGVHACCRGSDIQHRHVEVALREECTKQQVKQRRHRMRHSTDSYRGFIYLTKRHAESWRMAVWCSKQEIDTLLLGCSQEHAEPSLQMQTESNPEAACCLCAWGWVASRLGYTGRLSEGHRGVSSCHIRPALSLLKPCPHSSWRCLAGTK